jgi:hypothetical protein
MLRTRHNIRDLKPRNVICEGLRTIVQMTCRKLSSPGSNANLERFR